MTPERKAEQDAHDTLRDSIRAAALTLIDRNAAENPDDDRDPDYRAGIATGVLVDYIAVAVFDSGNDSHDYTAILRIDGKASHYRMQGLPHNGEQRPVSAPDMSIEECDRRLLQLWQRYEQADLHDDTNEAAAAYALLDALLDARVHLLAER